MKRLLLIFPVLLMTIGGFGQTRFVTNDMKRCQAVQLLPSSHPGADMTGIRPFIPGQKSSNPFVIGNTWYDTQTYNSGNQMNRIYEYPDGTIGATWMFKAASGPPDRGTAYNYYNGTAWSGAANHLGNDANNAFPSYAPWGPTGEIIAHYQYIAGEGPIKLLRREVKGSGDWVESILPPPPGNYSLVWHSMITSGSQHEFIHVLALVYDDPYQGQDDALLYYRSSDGGVTWEINGMLIEGLSSTYFKTISSLHYSWAQPVGNTIAFSYGFGGFDGLAFKSTDNGNTWQKLVVYEAPWTPYTIPDVTPIFGGGDGTSAIALDSQGNVHMAFGRMLWFYDVITTPPGGWYYYPSSTEGLIYWNENMPPMDSTLVSSYTLEFLEAGGNLVGWLVPTDTITISSDQPHYGVGLTSQPQLAIDADDNMFLIYSALSPENMIDAWYLRQIYSNASFDGGNSWTGIKKLTTDFQFIFSECVFPAVAPIVDETVQIVFQEDFEPGTGAGHECFMEYLNFPKDFFVGAQELERPDAFMVSQSYPNPASQSAQILVRLNNSATVSASIVNLTGQTCRKTSPVLRNTGDHTIRFDLSGLGSGVYCVVVQVGNDKVTRKLVVE